MQSFTDRRHKKKPFTFACDYANTITLPNWRTTKANCASWLVCYSQEDTTNILKCVQIVKVWFTVGLCFFVFFMLMVSANPPRISRQCQHKNEPRGPLCLLQKPDYSNKKITLQNSKQQAPKQNYHNASPHVVINYILYSSHSNTLMWFTCPNNETL